MAVYCPNPELLNRLKRHDKFLEYIKMLKETKGSIELKFEDGAEVEEFRWFLQGLGLHNYQYIPKLS